MCVNATDLNDYEYMKKEAEIEYKEMTEYMEKRRNNG